VGKQPPKLPHGVRLLALVLSKKFEASVDVVVPGANAIGNWPSSAVVPYWVLNRRHQSGSSIGRASDLGSECHGFESRPTHRWPGRADSLGSLTRFQTKQPKGDVPFDDSAALGRCVNSFTRWARSRQPRAALCSAPRPASAIGRGWCAGRRDALTWVPGPQSLPTANFTRPTEPRSSDTPRSPLVSQQRSIHQRPFCNPTTFVFVFSDLRPPTSDL
jgi:hypothetical protein